MQDLTLDLTQTFSRKEREIYVLLCQNLSNDEMAEIVKISVNGIKYRLGNIYRKLGVNSDDKSEVISIRAKAVSYAGTRIIERKVIKKVSAEMEQIYQSKLEVYGNKNLYTREEIIEASKHLTWFTRERVEEIIDDVFKILDAQKRKDPYSAMLKMDRVKVR